MTWPFENDTSGIVKRISNRSISANRKRNIFIVLTIVLASALLSAIVLYGFGVMQETQNRNQKTAQIMYHAISEQQGQELYKQEEIAWVGEFFNAFSEQVNHSTVNFTYANADMLKSQSMLYSGDLPASENEIVVQESFLDSLGYSNELGQTIQIPFSDGTTHVECVIALSKGEIDSKKVRVEFSLEGLDTSGLQKGATYPEIKARVLEQTGLKVSSLYISQVKQKCGLEVRENHHKAKSENTKQPQCPKEKEDAIVEALKHFQMI